MKRWRVEETAAADLGFEEDTSLGEESSDEQSAAAEEDEQSDPGRGESGSWDQGASCTQLLEPGLHEFKTLVDGLERAYWVRVPFVEQAPERYPVIFEFHGSTSSAEEEIAVE